jgi:hypothetical protein
MRGRDKGPEASARHPLIVEDLRHERFPGPIRPILAAIGVTETLELRRPEPSAQPWA